MQTDLDRRSTRPISDREVDPEGQRAELSVLFPEGEPKRDPDPDDFFADLNFDQVVTRVLTGYEDYDLRPLFSTPLRSASSVIYRQQALDDASLESLYPALARFSGMMRDVRNRLKATADRRPPQEAQAWGLEAVGLYYGAVLELTEALRSAPISSDAFQGVLRYLEAHTRSSRFQTLGENIVAVTAQLAQVRYTINIHGSKVTVARYQDQADYSEEVLATFERFRVGEASDSVQAPKPVSTVNHVEARVLDRVAQLFPDEFMCLDRFWDEWRDFIDPTIARFDREVQFYLSYFEFTRSLSAQGLSFCYPTIDADGTQLLARETFDVALAAKFVGDRRAIVRNDFAFAEPERVIVVTGPNQGGKTTFARAVGQLHQLARLGLTVPGVEARLGLCDAIFTHFEQQEHVDDLAGKLESDLIRTRTILDRITSRSLVIMNESYSSTSLEDARFLGREILGRIIDAGALCVYVTFIDELSRLGPATASMVGTVDAADPSIRTFRVVRMVADGKASAQAIAEKHGLTYDQLLGRIQ